MALSLHDGKQNFPGYKGYGWFCYTPWYTPDQCACCPTCAEHRRNVDRQLREAGDPAADMTHEEWQRDVLPEIEAGLRASSDRALSALNAAIGRLT